MSDDKVYTTSEVLKIFGVNRNTFQDLMDRGYVRPSIRKSQRQGDSNLFSRNDLYIIACYLRLVEMGFGRKLASELSYESSNWSGIGFTILIRFPNIVNAVDNLAK